MNNEPGGASNQFGGFGDNYSGNGASGTNPPSSFGAHPAANAPSVKSLENGPTEMDQISETSSNGTSPSLNPTSVSNNSSAFSGSSSGMSVSSFAETLRQENATRNSNMGFGGENLGSANPNSASGANPFVSNSTPGDNPFVANSAPNANSATPISPNLEPNSSNSASSGPTPPRPIEPEGLSRPMTKAAQAAPVTPKKSKKGLIIGLSCGAGALVLIVIAVVAVVISMLNKPDPVADAMDKLASNGLPPYIHADLSATAQLTDQTQMVSHYKLTGASDIMTSNMTNATDATVIVGGSDLDDTTFTVNEIYAGEKDLYFRFDGIYNVMDRIDAADLFVNGSEDEEELLCEDEDGEEVVCTEEMLEEKAKTDESDSTSNQTTTDDNSTSSDENGTTSKDKSKKQDQSNKIKVKNPFDPEMMQKMLTLSQVIDGDWVQIPPQEQSEKTDTDKATDAPTDETAETETEEEDEGLDLEEYTAYLTQALEDIGGRASICSIDLLAKFKNNASAMSTYYQKHPFISGSAENVTLASTRYPVYQIIIDPEKYNAFVDEIQNQGLLNEYLKCAGETITNVKNYPALLPPIFVEIDSDYNFSRLYVSTNTGTANVVLDLSLTYPATINVQKPQKFITLETVEAEMATLEAEAPAE